MTLVEALSVMLGVPDGGRGVVEWLQRLPGSVPQPGRKRLFGADDPDAVLVGAWRVAPTPDGVLLQLISGDVAVRTRRERGRAAAALVVEAVDRHLADLSPVQREQAVAQIAALIEIAEAGSV